MALGSKKAYIFALIISFLLILLFVPEIKNLKILVSMTELVDRNLPSSKNYQRFRKEFDFKNSVYINIKRKDETWKPDDALLIRDFIDQELLADSSIIRVYSPFSFYKAEYKAPDYIHYYKIVKPENNKTSEDFKNALKTFDKTPWSGLMTSVDGKEFSLEVHVENAPPPKKFGEFNPKSIENLISLMKKKFSESFDLNFTGTSIFTYFAFVGVQKNFKLNFIFLLFVLFLFRLLFGTFKSGIFLIFTLLFVGILLHGIMGYFHIPVEILSSGLFIMVAIASIEDYFFILHEDLKGIKKRAIFSKLLYPSFFTSFTTMIGFGSLYFSGIDVVARFGLMAGLGAFLEWLTVFFLLPAIMYFLNVETLVNKDKSLISTAKTWQHIINRFTPRKRLAYLSFIIYPFSFYVLTDLAVSDSPLSLFPKEHMINEDFSSLYKSRGWQGQASLVFDSTEQSERVQRKLIEDIKKLDNVKTVESYYDVKDFLHQSIPDELQLAVTNDYESSEFSKRYLSKNYHVRHFIYFKDTSFNVIKKSKVSIESLCQSRCLILGEIISYVEFMDKIPLAFIKSLGFSLLCVGIVILVLALRFGFPNPVLFVFSSLWGSSILLFLMWLFSIKINFLSCVFITLMVGVTGDNGIQFLFAHHQEKNTTSGIQYHQNCAFQVGILLAIMCMFFMLSYFAPPREFGPLMAVGFLGSIFGDICLAKATTCNDSESKRA